MAPRRLTAKQQAFVTEYLVDLNATQAAIRAGYSEKNADKIGSELLGKTGVAEAVQAALNERAKRTEITADRVIAELAAIAFADLTDVAAWSEDGELNMLASHQLSREASAAIKEVFSTTSTVTFDNGDERSTVYKKLKQHDKLKALELLGRHLGMFKRDVDVNVTVGITVGKLHELAASAEVADDEPGA